VDTLEDLVGACEDVTVGFLDGNGPIAPSCRNANESYLGFVVLDGRGGGTSGGVRRPWCCELTRVWPFATSDGLNPSEIPIASKS
jgi:hypothetical protein